MRALPHALPSDILRSDVNVVVSRTRARGAPGLEPILISLPELSRTVRAPRAGLPAAASLLLEPLRHLGVRAALQGQLVDIAREYCDVLGYPACDATLEVIKGTMCPRFHADVVEVRAICTLAGPGTQWVEDRHVDRARLRSLPREDAVGWTAIAHPSVVRQAKPGEVLYLKGSAFPGAKGHGAIHRSPDGASATSPRLLFKLDPPSTAPGDEAEAQLPALLSGRMVCSEAGCTRTH